MTANLVPQEFIEMYTLQNEIKNGYIYLHKTYNMHAIYGKFCKWLAQEKVER